MSKGDFILCCILWKSSHTCFHCYIT